MAGLLEAEPLAFKCLYGTDHMDVIKNNEQSKEYSKLETTNPFVGSSAVNSQQQQQIIVSCIPTGQQPPQQLESGGPKVH